MPNLPSVSRTSTGSLCCPENGGTVRSVEEFGHLLVNQDDKGAVVSVALPGVSPDAIDISYEDNVITISTQRPAGPREDGGRVLLNERFFGEFVRRLRVHPSLDGRNPDAVFEEGVLTLTFRMLPEAGPATIPVRAAGIE